MYRVEGCHVCATYLTFSPWLTINGKAQKGKVNNQFPENTNINSLLMKDLLCSSLTTFYQAVLAFTNAKTLQTPDSCTSLILHLIMGMAPNSLVFGWFSSHEQILCSDWIPSSKERLCYELYPHCSALFHCVFNQTTFPREKTKYLLQHANSLLH